ncbi:hypothetical protein [Vibrio mexicanus]|uniref:hypothetical protein n=1 Tax=Vibrio mexicanus TaxID=1004326 RepID=UPI00063CC8AB|nr:hypothetical protein [Vibrio mexicanus]
MSAVFSFKVMIGVLVVLLVSGCLEEEIDKYVNRETYAMIGTYDNNYNDQILSFKNGVMTHQMNNGNLVSRPFRVEGKYLYVQFRNSSKEKREDLVMVIHGEGELLSCNACAKHRLASIWTRQQ